MTRVLHIVNDDYFELMLGRDFLRKHGLSRALYAMTPKYVIA